MEIELYSKIQNANDMEKVANMLGKCGIFGNEKQEFGMAVLLTCAAERITPIQFARTYDLICGKVKKKAMAAFAEFRKRGGKVVWIKNGDDGVEAMAKIEFEGVTSEHRFHIDQAKKQGLLKKDSNWEKTPGNMLRSRLLSNALGMLCPEIYAGEDYDELAQPERGELLPSRNTVAEPKSEAKPKESSHVIDVQATAVPAEPVPESSKRVESPTAVQTYSESDIEIDPATNRLTNKAMAALGVAIGEANWDAAVQWCKKHHWIKDEISELSVERARRIIKQRDSFIGSITKGAQ